MNILVVDDEKNIVAGIKKRIKRFNDQLNVFEAYNGSQALNIIDNNNIDVCFVDINMPDMTGLSMIEKCNKKVEFVIVSGYGEFSYAQKAIELKVNSYLLKPIDKNEFNNILNKLVHKYAATDYSDNLKKIINIINENYMNVGFNLTLLSEMVNLSESYICRLVKKELNITFTDLLNKIRVDAAKKLIANKKDAINFKLVYAEVGFSSQQYFNVIFKKYTQMTPREYISNKNKAV